MSREKVELDSEPEWALERGRGQLDAKIPRMQLTSEAGLVAID